MQKNNRTVVRQQRRAGKPTFNISPEQFRQFSRTPKASGIGAIVQQKWQPLQNATEEASKGAKSLLKSLSDSLGEFLGGN